MPCASGKIALRVRMGLLAKRFDPLSSGIDCLPDPAWRRASRNIVDGEHRSQLQRLVKILIEGWTERSQFLERQVLQFTATLDTQLHCLADPFMRQTGRHPALYQVCSGRPRIHKSR